MTIIICKIRHAGEFVDWEKLEIAGRFDVASEQEADAQARRLLLQTPMAVRVAWQFEGLINWTYLERNMVEQQRLKELEGEVQQWRAQIWLASKALEVFQRKITQWGFSQYVVSEADFRAALKDLSDVGLEGWFDGNPQDIDKLYDLLVEGAYIPEPERSLVERVFGKLADSEEDDEYIEAQAEDYGEGFGMANYNAEQCILNV